MRLRLRCHETRERQKILVPNSCTVHQLQQVLCSSAPSSVHLSLNRIDELAVSSPDDSLHSLGITAGDLLYYSRDPMAFISPSQTVGSTSSSVQASIRGGSTSSSVQASIHGGFTSAMETEDSVTLESRNQEMAEEKDSPVQDSVNNQASGTGNVGIMFKDYDLAQESQISDLNCENKETLVGDLGAQNRLENDLVSSIEKGKTPIQEDTEPIHVDDEYLEIDRGWIFSEPYFLRRILTEELGDNGSQQKLLAAVHAVLLQSGFVGFNPDSGERVDGFNLPENWPSMTSSLSLWYTLPELLNNGSNATVSILLKFQKLGHFLNVYGSLANDGSGLHRVCLDENRFLPAIHLMWENCDKSGRMNDKEKSLKSDNENVVFEFWRMVKDGIALPLLIDLCDKTGLLLPACMMRLPTEMKVRILELLPGIDVARMGCVCTEMRYLASSNDLWRQKFVEEFRSGSDVPGYVDWKNRFATFWRKRRIQENAYAPRPHRGIIDGPPTFLYPVFIGSEPLRFPVMWGDNNRFGFHAPFGPFVRRHPRSHGRGNFSPQHNRGRFNFR